MRAPVPLAREKSTPTGKPPRGGGSSGSGIRQEPGESFFPRGRSRSCDGRGPDASFPEGSSPARLPEGKQYLVPRGEHCAGSAEPGVVFPRGNSCSGLAPGDDPSFPAGASSACAPAGKEYSFPRGRNQPERLRGRPFVPWLLPGARAPEGGLVAQDEPTSPAGRGSIFRPRRPGRGVFQKSDRSRSPTPRPCRGWRRAKWRARIDRYPNAKGGPHGPPRRPLRPRLHR